MNKAEIFLMVIGALGTLGILCTVFAVCWHTVNAKKAAAREQLILDYIDNDLAIVDRWCRHEYPIIKNICARYRNFIATQGTWDSSVEMFRQELRTAFPAPSEGGVTTECMSQEGAARLANAERKEKQTVSDAPSA